MTEEKLSETLKNMAKESMKTLWDHEFMDLSRKAESLEADKEDLLYQKDKLIGVNSRLEAEVNQRATDYKRLVEYVDKAEAEVKRLRDENADWMTESQKNYNLRMKAESRLSKVQIEEERVILLSLIFKNWKERGHDSWDDMYFDDIDTVLKAKTFKGIGKKLNGEYMLKEALK